MSFKQFSPFLLLTLTMRLSVVAEANSRDENNDDEYAWEFRPRLFVVDRSNPLIGRPGPDTKVDIDIRLSYYGEHFFIDDVIGYTWFDNGKLMFSSIASVSDEYVLFSESNFKVEDVPELSKLDKREPIYTVGVELLYTSDWGEVALQVQSGSLGEETGHKADLRYSRTFIFKGWEIRPEFGILWLNDDYANYFYGVSSSDSAATSLPEYETGSAINEYFLLETRYKIASEWNFIAGYYVQIGDNSITDSPLLVANKFRETYVGIEWVARFNLVQ